MAQRIHPGDLLSYDLYAFACVLALAKEAGVFNPADPALRRAMLTRGVSSKQIDEALERAEKVWDDVEHRTPLSDPLDRAEADGVSDDFGRIDELVVVDCDTFCDDPEVTVLEALVAENIVLYDVSYSVVTAGPGDQLVVSAKARLEPEEEEDDSIDDTSVEEEPNPLAHGLTVHEDLPDFDDLDFGDDEDEDE